MSASTVITVNPSARPLGAADPGLGLRSGRARTMALGHDMAYRKSSKTLQMIFGETARKQGLSLVMLILRLGTAVIMGIESFDLLMAGEELPIVVMLGCGAISMGLGMFTRVINGIVAICLAMICLNVTDIMQLPLWQALICVSSGIFALVGPGRYSVDSILKRYIFRSVRRHQTRRLLENRFSYRIYSYSHI